MSAMLSTRDAATSIPSVVSLSQFRSTYFRPCDNLAYSKCGAGYPPTPFYFQHNYVSDTLLFSKAEFCHSLTTYYVLAVLTGHSSVLRNI